MTVERLLQPYADTLGAAARSADGGSYLTAYLSASAVEALAVAALAGLAAWALGRGLMGAARLGGAWASLWRGLDIFAFSKLLIPVVCLAGLATVWVSTAGS